MTRQPVIEYNIHIDYNSFVPVNFFNKISMNEKNILFIKFSIYQPGNVSDYLNFVFVYNRLVTVGWKLFCIDEIW